MAADGAIHFSLDASARSANGAVFQASDLLVYQSSGIARVISDTEAWDARDLESLAVDPATGFFVVAFASSGRVGSSGTFAASELIRLGFGPGAQADVTARPFLVLARELESAPAVPSALELTR